MMKRLSITIAVVIITVASSITAWCGDDIPVNVSAANRAAMAEVVDHIQHYELQRLNRGRLRPNPVIFPLHTIYQTVLQDQEYLLDRHRDIYENSLMGLQKVFADFEGTVFSEKGRIQVVSISRELLQVYNLSERLRNQETAIEVWKVLEDSRMEMELLPVRARMGMNTLKWLLEFYDGNIPDEVYGEFMELSSRKLLAENIIGIESSTSALAIRYSDFMIRVATGWHPAPVLEVEAMK